MFPGGSCIKLDYYDNESIWGEINDGIQNSDLADCFFNRVEVYRIKYCKDSFSFAGSHLYPFEHCLSVCLSVYLSTCLSVHPSIHPSNFFLWQWIFISSHHLVKHRRSPPRDPTLLHGGKGGPRGACGQGQVQGLWCPCCLVLSEAWGQPSIPADFRVLVWRTRC